MALFETFKDDFNPIKTDEFQWQYIRIINTNGQVYLQSNLSEYSSLHTEPALNLTILNSSVFVEITPANSGTRMTVYDTDFSVGNGGARFEYVGNHLYAITGHFIDIGYLEPETTIDLGVLDLSYKFWRIRQSGAKVYFDISKDSRDWIEKTSLTSPFIGTSQYIEFELFDNSVKDIAILYGLNTVLTTNINASLEPVVMTADTTMSRQISFKRTLEPVSMAMDISMSYILNKNTSNIAEKKYLYKIYDENGNYLGILDDVINDPEYTQEINSLGSTMTVTLARNSDSMAQEERPLLTEDGQNILTEDGQNLTVTDASKRKVLEGSDIQHNNRVDVYAYYGSTEPLLTENDMPILTEDGEEILVELGYPNGIRIFSGFISDINLNYGQNENTVLTLSSYGWDLGQFPLMNGTSTTVSYNSVDPSTIPINVLSKFNAETTDYAKYTHTSNGSVQMTNTTVSYTFKNNTYEEALKKAIELMPSDFYYYIGLGDNVVYYKQKATVPEHLFYLGKHIVELKLKSTIANSTNDVIFTGGGEPALFKRYTTPRGARTRRKLERYSDNRVTLEQSAQIIAESKIAEDNKVQYQTTLNIASGVYDIESIKVGQIVGFRNFDNEIDNLTMQIVGLNYSPDAVQLQLDTLPPTVNKRLEDIKRNLKVEENKNIPNSL